MPDGGEGMVEEHAGTGPAHDGADAFAHFFAVAMDGAIFAGRFADAEFASVEPPYGVAEKFSALAAEFFVMFFVPAIHAYHQSDNFLFFRQSVVYHKFII